MSEFIRHLPERYSKPPSATFKLSCSTGMHLTKRNSVPYSPIN